MFVLAGATGCVGSATAQQLIAADQQVRAIVRDAGKAAALEARGAELAVGSLEDPHFLTSALSGAAGAFLLCPPNFATDDLPAYQARIAASLAEAVQRSAVPHVVVLSSIGADHAAGNGPIRGLHALENALRDTGATVTALRPGFFQENVAAVLPLARTQGIYPSFMPRQAPLPMIATRDIGGEAAAALRDAPAQNQIVDLAGPSYSADEVAAVLGRLAGRPVQTVEIPPEQHVGALIESGFSPHIAGIFAEMYSFFLSGKVRPVGARLVQAPTPLEETLRGIHAGA